MKNTLALSFSLGVISLLSVGCQTLAPVPAPDRKLSKAKPTSAKPLPAWTKRPDQALGDQQLLITTKLIEVTRPAGSADIPAQKYERKLSAPQFELFIREMAQKKGADLLTAPSVVTRDGQKAAVEIIREFSYPVAPGEDAKLEVENVGVSAHFDARHIGSRKISIKTFTRVSEFDGFSEVKPGFDLPVFKRRDVEASALLRSGETIVVGGILDETSQDIEDTGPLGILKKRSTQTLSRELILAVTATLVKPDGTRVTAR